MTDFSPRAILATGVTGFVGSHLARTLESKGHRVTRMRRDVRDPDTFPRGQFDLIVHAAAMVDKKYWGSPELYEVNVEGTRRLLDAFPHAKMVFISSADVERDTLTPYATSKRDAERLVLERSASHLAVRPPSVFGPGDTHDKLVPRLFAKYRLGQSMTMSEGRNEFIFVEDLANQLAEGLSRSGIWRIHGRTISNRQLDHLVGLVCRGEAPSGLDEDASYFYRGLKSIGEDREVIS